MVLCSLLGLLNILELHCNLIRLEKNRFAGIFVLKFLKRQELTIAVQLILDRLSNHSLMKTGFPPTKFFLFFFFVIE